MGIRRRRPRAVRPTSCGLSTWTERSAKNRSWGGARVMAGLSAGGAELEKAACLSRPFPPAPADLNVGVMHQLELLAGCTRPFELTLSHAGTFTEAVYRAPQPACPFIQLREKPGPSGPGGTARRAPARRCSRIPFVLVPSSIYCMYVQSTRSVRSVACHTRPARAREGPARSLAV